ncbi:hypothetical protein DP939_43335 [Spongiactinospora rosea]|uniref:Uncharacterized protein n=1 Tax=Spongiactinospora rosea TaxID=2248750 RepID=A0A366LJ63_9ACTN|nr:hypothetical protein [Spongiactinospora rosea]RBQ13926.1 hypothetical protein DP939_43335 [Spongiactinospora rosea]
MDLGIEQQLLAHHAFQDADGLDHRGDRDPGNLPRLALGLVVAVAVAGGLEDLAVDQVPA